MLKKCTALWREADLEVKCVKNWGVRSSFGSWDDEKAHAVVARSTFPSQNVQNTPWSEHFWKLRCRKCACRCGAKHIWKSKCTKHTILGPLLEIEMSKMCMPLWREAHLEVKMYKTLGVRTTFGSSDLEKVHAVVARSTFRSQNVKNTRGSDHFWRFRCRFASLHYTTLQYTTLLLVVEVKAFQWNVRPRWGRNFWKSVRCCVQLVFSMFVFSPVDGLSWVFHGYHADGCSYSLVFWEFCTSLVVRSVLCKIHTNTDDYWVDVITSAYGERPAWAAPITLTYWCIFWHFA